MSKENSAVEILLDKINDLVRRVELLEERVLHPTFTNIYNTVPATYSNYTIGATPTVTRAEMTAYGQSIADMYEDRLDEIQRQLDNLNFAPSQIPEELDVEPMTYEIRDGNLYINPITNEGVNP